MGSSFKLFTIRDIDIRLHFTFPLILVWAAVQFGLLSGNLSSALFGVVGISLLFVLVTLHELGHSFAAQYYGVPVRQIVLSPLGGVAQLSRMPSQPIQEFVIAIAGPAVNVIFALLMGAVAIGLGINIVNPFAVVATGGFTLASLFSYVFVYNIVLAVFNLLPAFPMDGGRILRALMAMRWDYVRATTTAATIGRVVAVLMGLYGLFNGGFFLVLIAIFIYTAASQEVAVVKARDILKGYTVQDVYTQSVYQLAPDSSLQQATNLMLLGGQASFPVVEDGVLVGFLPRASLVAALKSSVPHAPVSRFMLRDVAPVAPGDDLFDVQQRIFTEQSDALPVTYNGRFLGLISAKQISSLRRLLTTNPHVIPQSRSA